MSTWKKIVLVSAGFGAGFALTLTCIAGALAWYRDRPRAWNTRALEASFDTMEFDTQPSKESYIMKFMYDVRNNTGRNYQLIPLNLTTMAILTDGNALSNAFGSYQTSDATIEGPAFIPPQSKVRIVLQLSYQYPPEFTTEDKANLKKVVVSVDRRLNEVGGFVIFDQHNYYRVDLPGGWKNLPTNRIGR